MDFRKNRILFAVLILGISLLGCNSGNGSDLPNILWLSTEDIGPELGCYGDPNAISPFLD